VRKARRFLNLLVPAIGMALVIGAVLFGESIGMQLFLVVAGLLLTESGLWRLADPILPDERKYIALRSETDHFTALVRQLNTAALAVDRGDESGSRLTLDEVRLAMHHSVDRMVEFAGMTADELPPDQAGREGASTESVGLTGPS
jgi:hypothetical protein